MQKAVNFSPPTWTQEMKDFLDQQIALAMTGKESSKSALDNAVNKANQLLVPDPTDYGWAVRPGAARPLPEVKQHCVLCIQKRWSRV